MRQPKNKYYLYYSMIYVAILTTLFFVFWGMGKTFVWRDDGISQNVVEFQSVIQAIMHSAENNIYSNYSLVENNLIFRFFYWGIRNFLVIFANTNTIIYFYIAIFVLQTYFSGIAFLLFCDYKGLRQIGQLIGSVVYVFNAYFVYCLLQPEYGHTMLFVPLLFIGIEKIIDEKRGLFFTAMVTLATLSCVTYIYPITSVLAIYILVVLYEKSDRKFTTKIFGYYIHHLFRIISYWVLGILMSGILIIPMWMGIRNSPRMDTVITGSLWHYNYLTYSQFIVNIFTPLRKFGFGNFALPSFVLLAFVAICIKKDKTPTQKSPLILCVVSVILYGIPLWGLFTKGFSNVSNYWYFVIMFFAAYTCTCGSEILLTYENRKVLIGIVGTTAFIYIALLWYCKKKEFTYYAILWITIMFFITICLAYFKTAHWKKFLILSFVTVNVGININISAHLVLDSFLDKNLTLNKFYARYPDSAAKDVDDKTFYRIDKYTYLGEFNLNLPQWYGYNGMSVFHSVLMNEPFKYFLETENRGLIMNNKISDLDNRSMAEILANTKYFLSATDADAYIPYGYNLFKKTAGDNASTDIYINKYDLSLGYTYSNTEMISEAAATQLNGLEKQELMLQVPILSSTASENIDDYTFTSQELSWEVINSDSAEISNDKLSIINDKGSVDLQIKHPSNSEIYIRLNNIYPGTSKYTCDVSTEHVKKTFLQYEEGNFHKINRDSCFINLGYQEKAGILECKISLKKGEYSLDDFQIFSQSMDNLDSYVAELMDESFEVASMDSNTIEGSIGVSSDKWLCFSLPYSTGWTVFVDRKKVDTECLNYMYLGILIEEGQHEIKLEYHIPGFKIGVICSVIALAIFSGIAVYEKKQPKRRIRD